MFMAFLSMTSCKRVTCHFLISGHSHMCPDRVVSHVKCSFGIYALKRLENKYQEISEGRIHRPQ